MKIILKLCATSLLLACTAPVGAGVSTGEGMRFRCESDRSQPSYCSVDTSDGITLVKQLSGTPCMQGRNWDYDRHGVWVSHRCRAEFVTGTQVPPVEPAPQDSIRCESRANRIERCPADTSKGVRLTRLLSASDCVENRDWGHDREGIWTARGCRAEFSLGGGGGTKELPVASPSRLTCQSGEQQRQRCRAAVNEGVDLLRQLSKTRCVEGANWGWDREGVWVDKGCRAEFRVR